MKKAEIDEILMPGDEAQNQQREEDVRSGFWKKITENAHRVPFMEDAVTAYYCALDSETPARVRGVLLAALAYFLLPTDAIPDFLVGFGLTDDITVFTLAFTTVSANIKDSHRVAAQKALKQETLDTE